MRKSTWGRLRATRNPQETRPRVPHLFERLEPRLLLSVVWENVQPTDPVTPEGYALYVSASTQRVDPTPEQTSIFIVDDGTQTRAKVTLVFPDSGYEVTNWGTVQRQDNTFFVNAEVTRQADPPDTVVTTLAHEYDLGTLAYADYVFEFRAWDQLIESREFRPGPAQDVPYVPTAEQTNVLVMADGAGGTKARVIILFSDMGYGVRDWGTVQQTGSTFLVNAEVEKWAAGAATSFITVSHDYDLGSLPDGNYVFQFNAWQQPVENKEFATPAALRPVYRFWSPKFARHFYTLSTAERDKLINNYSGVWTYEQAAYYAFTTDAEPDTVPVYRFWSGTLNTHFYTANQAERDKLITNYSQTWADEGIAFYAYPHSPGYERPIGTQPVYRLWSPTLGTHFFTTNQTEMDKLFYFSTHLWEYEGAGWYAHAAVMLDRQGA